MTNIYSPETHDQLVIRLNIAEKLLEEYENIQNTIEVLDQAELQKAPDDLFHQVYKIL